MIFVFDRLLYMVPDEGQLCSGFYYEKTKYMANIANGIWADGILGHGSLFIDIFKSKTPYETILTDDITDETNLLYLIEPWPSFDGLREKEGLEDISNPVNWNITLRFIPKKILQLAKDKRLTILFHIPEFTFGIERIKSIMNSTIKQLEIPKSQFKFISGMRDDDWYYWPGFEYSQFVCYNDAEVVKKVNLNRREKKFTCLNRVDKTHRRHTALNLWNRDLIKDGYFSYSFVQFGFENGLYILKKANWDDDTTYFNESNWEVPYSQWKEFHEAGPWTADDLSIEEHNHHWHVEQQHYTEEYWN